VADHKSAHKRARQALRRRSRNRHQQTRVRSAVKRVRAALAEGDSEATAGALRNAESLLRRAASKGVIPWKRASRQVSRLAKASNQLQS
jgi:small subunit ribosomal protein S20